MVVVDEKGGLPHSSTGEKILIGANQITKHTGTALRRRRERDNIQSNYAK